MTDYNLSDIEELILCGHCRRPFNDSNLLPKDLACKHSFCLECIQSGLGKASVTKGSASRLGELYCELCWKLTELTDKGPQALETNSPKLALVQLYMQLKGENSSLTNGSDATNVRPSSDENSVSPLESCGAHGSPLELWCINCEKPICIECQKSLHSEPQCHRVWTLQRARDQMVKEAYAELSDMSHLDENVRQLAKRQRQFLILIRDACTALMREVQSSLDSDWNVDPTVEIREALTQIQIALMDAKSPKEVHKLFPVLLMKKQELQAKCQEMIIQCQLNDLIGHSDDVFNFDALREAVASILSNKNDIKPLSLQQPLQDPILFLTNYCMSQLFSRLHQRVSGDSFLLNHNMQRQLIISPPDLANPTPPAISAPPQDLAAIPLNDPSDIFANSNEINLHQIEYSPKNVQAPIQPPAQMPVQPPVQLPAPMPVQPLEQLHVPVQLPVQPPIQPPVQAHPGIDATDEPPPPSPPPPFSPPSLQATTAQIVQMQSTVETERVEPPAPIIHPPVRPVPARSPANVCPRYFFNIDINGVAKGKIVIETRPDVAPKMCRNFDRLTTADRKASYKGCNFFQCWKNESVITGDYECNTGRGGRSIYEDGYFQPDETRFPAVRGAVGMRRQQKKHDYFGFVGSQFRIILQDMQGFTGIFGHVVEGIELVEAIANFGDHTGKPTKTITISKCGKL